ncbi:MAG: excalibur calcium-binding domain-containing protein [Mycobacterium sp.]
MASADPPYANCTEAHKDGRYDIPQGDPAYRSKLDRDGDGIACES